MNRLLPFLVVFMLISCTTPTPHQDRMRVGTRRGPDSFNPYLSTTISGEIVAARLFPTLFREEPVLKDGLPKLTPVLVSDYAWDPSETTLTLSVKQGLQWSDGTPVSAHDIGYTLGIQVDPRIAWISADLKSGIDSWNVLSPNKLEILFKRKSPFNLLDLNEGVIIPKHHFEKQPLEAWTQKEWWSDLVVFGPYRVETFQAGERLVLESLEPGRVPALGMAFVREKETLYQLLRNGELDFAWGLSTTRMSDIQEHLQPGFYKDHSYAFIAWNPIQPTALEDNPIQDRAMLETLKTQAAHPLFADPKVRLAMTLALRRDHYLNLFWKNQTHIPATPWQAGPYYREDGPKTRAHNTQKAAELLDEAGWILKDGVRWKDNRAFRFTIAALAGNSLREDYLLAIQADLSQLGVEMEIDMQEVSRYVSATQSRNFDALFAVLRTGSRPDSSSLFHGDAALSGGYNYASWTSADPHLEQMRDATDAQTLLAGMAQAEQVFFQEQPFTMLYGGLQIAAGTRDGPIPQSCWLDPLHMVETWRKNNP